MARSRSLDRSRGRPTAGRWPLTRDWPTTPRCIASRSGDPRCPPRRGPPGRRPGRAGRGLRAQATPTMMRCSTRPTCASDRRSCGPTSLRDFYAFEGHVATMWARRGNPVPEAWYRLPDLLLQQRVRDPRSERSRLGAARLDRARLRAGGVRPHRHSRPRPCGRGGRGGDRRLHDPQRLERPRPPARGNHGPPRPCQGQGLREHDRALAGDARRAGQRPDGGREPARSSTSRAEVNGARDLARNAGPTPSSRSARCSPAHRPTQPCARAT